MTKTLGQRIKLARGKDPQEAFAVAIGVSRGALSFYERDENQPGAETLARICAERKILPEWLLLGTGPMTEEDATITDEETSSNPRRRKTDTPETVTCADAEIVMVPMVEAVLSAGMGSFENSGEIERKYAFRYDFLRRKGQIDKMVLMRVSGDSMDPEIKDGDVVLLDQSQTTPRPGKIYAVGIEDAVYLKVVNTIPGKIVLTSYNSVYPQLEIDTTEEQPQSIRIIGRAVWWCREA